MWREAPSSATRTTFWRGPASWRRRRRILGSSLIWRKTRKYIKSTFIWGGTDRPDVLGLGADWAQTGPSLSLAYKSGRVSRIIPISTVPKQSLTDRQLDGKIHRSRRIILDKQSQRISFCRSSHRCLLTTFAKFKSPSNGLVYLLTRKLQISSII